MDVLIYLCSSAIAKGRRYLRFDDRVHNSADHNGVVGAGGRSSGGFLLVDGLSSQTEDHGTATSPTGVPESAVHDARAHRGAQPRLPHVTDMEKTNKL